MADEFDLNPTSRGEEFLDVILRSLGGDTPDIPQPAWRHEEYLAAIANAIQNGGGGGSGGGVLVVHEDEDTGALDKTWQEINNADFAVVCSVSSVSKTFMPVLLTSNVGGVCRVSVLESGLARWFYETSSADGYPVYVDPGE